LYFPAEGLYTWAVSQGILGLSVVSDEYPARVGGIAGSWNVKNLAEYTNLIGSVSLIPLQIIH